MVYICELKLCECYKEESCYNRSSSVRCAERGKSWNFRMCSFVVLGQLFWPLFLREHLHKLATVDFKL